MDCNIQETNLEYDSVDSGFPGKCGFAFIPSLTTVHYIRFRIIAYWMDPISCYMGIIMVVYHI